MTLPPAFMEAAAGRVNREADRVRAAALENRRGSFAVEVRPATAAAPLAAVVAGAGAFEEEYGTPGGPGTSWALRAAWGL